jgi:AcrR family transcriptional regulator
MTQSFRYSTVNTRDTIIEAAGKILSTTGITELTVSRVARAAKVSSALVHYHFTTKRRLLVAAARQLAAQRTDGRIRPLQKGNALDCLDALWLGVARGAGGGAERAWLDLEQLAREDPEVQSVLSGERDRERTAAAAALPRLLESLGSRPRLPADDIAAVLVLLLDGIALSLAGGARDAEVRSAYDAFWLALVALGQAAPAR